MSEKEMVQNLAKIIEGSRLHYLYLKPETSPLYVAIILNFK
jgi:hypothetical protein